MTPAERTAKIAELRAEADRLEGVNRGLELSDEEVDAYMSDRQPGGPDSDEDWVRWSRRIGRWAYALAVSRRTIKTSDAPDPHPHCGGGVSIETATANGYLMAYAPRLLEICREQGARIKALEAQLCEPGKCPIL